jgi:hypothetical protein
MISWLWLIPAMMFGACIGVVRRRAADWTKGYQDGYRDGNKTVKQLTEQYKRQEAVNKELRYVIHNLNEKNSILRGKLTWCDTVERR